MDQFKTYQQILAQNRADITDKISVVFGDVINNIPSLENRSFNLRTLATRDPSQATFNLLQLVQTIECWDEFFVALERAHLQKCRDLFGGTGRELVIPIQNIPFLAFSRLVKELDFESRWIKMAVLMSATGEQFAEEPNPMGEALKQWQKKDPLKATLNSLIVFLKKEPENASLAQLIEKTIKELRGSDYIPPNQRAEDFISTFSSRLEAMLNEQQRKQFLQNLESGGYIRSINYGNKNVSSAILDVNRCSMSNEDQLLAVLLNTAKGGGDDLKDATHFILARIQWMELRRQ